MDDINLKNIRVIPTQLDLRGNYAKTLADLVPQLQSGGIVRGVVINATKDGEIIFNTPIGRFISPNPMGLSRGDNITIRLAKNGEQFVGNIFKVNSENADEEVESVNVAFVKTDAPVRNTAGEGKRAHQSHPTILNLSGTDLDSSTEIHGSITYINLNKLNSNKLLYKTITSYLDKEQQNIPIKLVLVDDMELANGIQFSAQVASIADGESQMLKTNFGIITLKDAPALPVDQELTFALTNINNKPVETNVKNELVNFIFNLNNVLPKLQKFLVHNQVAPKNNLIPAAIDNEGNVEFHDAVINFLSGTTEEMNPDPGIDNNKLVQTKPSLILDKTPVTINGVVIDTAEIVDKRTVTLVATNKTADEVSNKAPAAIKEAANLVDKEAMAAVMTGKIANELASLSNLMASVRVNTRRLSDNFEHTIEEIADEEESSKSELKLSRAMLDELLSDASDLDDIKKLSSEMSNIKDILNMQSKNLDNNQNFSLMIPIYIDDELHEQEVVLSYVSKDVIRILMNFEFLEMGQFQIDALIKFHLGSKIPESFNLIIRSRNKLDNLTQNQLNNIFLDGQKITGIKGNIGFEMIS